MVSDKADEIHRRQSRLGFSLSINKPLLRNALLLIQRYILEAFQPATEQEAESLRKVTGGLGAPILSPSAASVTKFHEKYGAPYEGAESAPPRRDASARHLSRKTKRSSVLVLSTDSKTFGGIQRYAWMWAQALYDLGYSPRTVSLWRRGVVPETSVSRRHALSFAATALAVTITRRPIAVICTHIGLSPVAGLLGRLFKIPYAVSLHGDDSWRKPYSAQVERALRDARLLLPVSYFTRDVVAENLGMDTSRFYVTGSILSPALELAAARRDPQAYERALATLYGCADEATPREEASIPREPISPKSFGPQRKIITVARLDANSHYKRHDLVLRAVARLATDFPDLTYTIVGDGSYRPFLEKLVAELGIGDRVDFVGKVTDDALVEHIASSWCLAMPSRISLEPAEGEGFGLVYLEAGIFGVPSIAARAGGSQETVLDRTTGLLAEPDSLDSLIACMRVLLSDSSLRARLGENARLRALEFSYPRFKERCNAVMESLLSGRPPAAIFPEYPRDRLFSDSRQVEAAGPGRLPPDS